WSSIQGSRHDPQAFLKKDRRNAAGVTHTRAQRILVAVEVALSVVMLVGAGLMLKSVMRLRNVDPGFLANETVAVDLSLGDRYRTPESRARFFRDLVERVEALPGVHSAGVVSHLPLSEEHGSRPFIVDNGSSLHESEKSVAEYRRVSARYFEAMGIRVVRGRPFNANDTDGSPAVAIVNEAMAKRFLSGQDPLGKKLIIEDGPHRPREIVGIVNDVKHFGLDVGVQPEMYIPQVDRPWPNMVLVARAERGDPSALVSGIRGAVMALDKSIPLANVKTMNQYLVASTGRRRFSMNVLAGFAAFALLLAAFGVHAVVAHAVEQRTHEIGIRMALGAERRNVLRLVIAAGYRPVLIGLLTGIALSLAAMRVMGGWLYGVSAVDPATYLSVTMLLAVVTLVACFAPAWRAVRVDPVACIRI
ncbi:MAG: ABC transporter permease, partial [Vicinamibacteria bacterium]|nr:ABC transporter permease [Vicinamibacteria bacterium]